MGAIAALAAEPLPARVGGDWLAGVQRHLAEREYWASENSLGLQAPNRKHGLRTYFEPTGIRVHDRTAGGSPELMALSVTGVGRGDALSPAAPGEVSSEGARIEIRRDVFVEWYENSPAGLEQGFTWPERPGGDGPLAIELALTGASASLRGQELLFTASSGRKLRYGALAALDVKGRPLAARMALTAEGRVRLEVDDAGAEYPVLLDPLLSEAADTQLESNQADAELGFSVAGAGDVNADGYADVIVGARSYDAGEINEGAAFVFLGSGAGIADGSPVAAAQLEANQANAFLGRSVAGAGDVNGDGYADVIVGAWQYDSGEIDEGAAFVFLGSTTGVAAGSPATAAAQLEANQAGARLGTSLAGAGDVNGDGFADVMVGAPFYDAGEADEGAAFVFLGSGAGIADGNPATAAAQLEANQAGARFGISVAGLGDVDGDGHADTIVGSGGYDAGEIDEGAAFVFLGSAAGVADGNPATAATQLESNQASSGFGVSVAGAGDVNGDGYADALIGAWFYDAGQVDEGAAFVFQGSATGIADGSPTTAAARLESNQANAQLGLSVAGAGDVNGDGYADVIVGAWFYDAGQVDEGAAFVFQGSATGIANGSPATAAAQLESSQANAEFGISVAGAGDVNGDGYADVLVGAPFQGAGEVREGAAFVYVGGGAGIPDGNATTAATRLEFDIVTSTGLGTSVAGAGDVNGDGYADVIVSAPGYDNPLEDQGVASVLLGSAAGIPTFGGATRLNSGQAYAGFGISVAGAGDVNGDGYADVIVGADFYDAGQTDEGAAFLFRGSSSGIASANSTTAAAQLESNQAFAALGNSVAGAGDVNGDGYADVIVGAHLYDAPLGTGAAFVFLGSASGIASGNPATAAAQLESNQMASGFGVSVAGAGDVNGDGYADVIVGDSGHDGGQAAEGAAFVFLGSASGIASGNPATAATQLESNQANAFLGSSVAGAGDVNGDGYADVIVGAELYEALGAFGSEGAAFVFLGSASGVASGNPATAATQLASGQGGALLGSSVAGAGDVNGDGYADVIVGARSYDAGENDEGAAFVFLGSASGIASGSPATAAAQLESNQVGARLGNSVAGAGDVNGDGYADVIVGASSYDDAAQTNGGAAFVFLGNGKGRPVLARQRRGDGFDLPVQPWGGSGSSGVFEVELRATHPEGSGRVRAEFEVCPTAVPLGHASCTKTTTPTWVTVDAAAPEVILSQSLSTPPSGGLHRWRARVLHAPRTGALPANPSHGPWRRVNAQAVEADIRPVPEPGGALLLGCGVLLLGVLVRGRPRASSC